jgi:vancomycin permeability regulator SanA
MLRTLLILAVGGLVLASGPFAWTRVSAAGHLHAVADAPAADVVIVLGAQVAPGGTRPMPFLAGRLRTAAALVHAGKARVILVSGDANGTSGDETRVMRDFLTGEQGVDPARVVLDPHGLDSYDTCARAVEVFGVRRALVVTQSYHLARAVALCRDLGVDADGVAASCADCLTRTLVLNTVRDFLACSKAAVDAVSGRPPAVRSDPDPAVTEALAR